MNTCFTIPCLYTDTKVVEPTQRMHTKEETKPSETNDIKKEITIVADFMKENKILSENEIDDQVKAVHDFVDGKMSYAEMRMRAG